MTIQRRSLIKCSYADTYKAEQPPKCNCETCWQKWESVSRAKARVRERMKR